MKKFFTLLLICGIIFHLNGCTHMNRHSDKNIFTKYIVYYHRNHLPWMEIRCCSLSPEYFIESAPDTLIETDKKKVMALYNYFDSIAQLQQSVLLDGKFSFTQPKFRHIDTDLALVFVGNNRQDTLALESQHYGGMSFHQRFFIDSIGHFKVFNIIRERDSDWDLMFKKCYQDGVYSF